MIDQESISIIVPECSFLWTSNHNCEEDPTEWQSDVGGVFGKLFVFVMAIISVGHYVVPNGQQK